MNENNIFESNAFCEGADLWIIKNDPSLYWWKKLDFGSKFLLSENHLKQKKQTAPELEKIINATNLKLSENKTLQNHLLLGSEDHFLNRWILLWNDLDESELAELIEKSVIQLKTVSVRLFSDSHVIPALKSRLSASSITISYIENI